MGPLIPRMGSPLAQTHDQDCRTASRYDLPRAITPVPPLPPADYFHVSITGASIPSGHTIVISSLFLGLTPRGLAEIVASRQGVQLGDVSLYAGGRLVFSRISAISEDASKLRDVRLHHSVWSKHDTDLCSHSLRPAFAMIYALSSGSGILAQLQSSRLRPQLKMKGIPWTIELFNAPEGSWNGLALREGEERCLSSMFKMR